ncbi:MAG: LysM domain-containing protein, partial [Mesorhizobium sp.]
EVERRETAPKGRWLAAVSTEGGGLGSPSLYLGGYSAMGQPWSYAPVRHDVVADAKTQNRPADVEPGQTVQDGWEHTITAEQQREAEAAAAEADAELDDALAGFEAEFDEFKNEWAQDHGASVGADGTLLLPADQYEALAAEWEEDYEGWWNTHSAELNASYANYEEAVALELRLAALEAESQGEDPNQAVSDQAGEIRDGQDQTAVDAIDAAEEQVLGETQTVRAAQVDYAEESQALQSAEALPDNLSDKADTVDAAQAEADEAAAALEAAVAEQMEDLGQEVLVELADQLGVTAPNADHYRPGELPQTLADLSDEELAELIQEALGQLDDPESVADVIDSLSEDTRNALATALAVEPDELGAVLGDPGQLAEAMGAEDAQAAIDILADQLIGMAAGEVSEAHGNISYIDALLFGSDDSPGVVDQVAVDLRAGELGRIIEEIDPAELSGVEKELWEAGDQVSVALLRQFGVSFVETQNVTAEGGGVTYAVVDGVPIELEYHEQRLLEADPVALALLLKSGFRIEGIDDAGAFTITLDGDAYDMAGLAEEADAQAWLAALATQAREDDASLAMLAGFLWRSNAAGLSQRDLMLLAAHDAYVAASVRDQMEATDDVQERWRLYDDTVGATLTSGDLLWRETSDLLDDQGGYDDIVAGIVDDEANRDDLGGALADMLKGYTGTGAAELDAITSTSPEHAAAILRAVLDNVDLDTLYDAEGTDAFFEQLSALVETADSAGNPANSTSWAQEVADWWAASLEQRDGGSAGHLWNPETGYEFLPTALEDTVRSGYGAALSEELASTLDGKGWWEPGDTPFTASFEQARDAYEEALRNAPASPAAIAQAYEDFQSRRDELVPNYFDRIMGQEGIGEAQEVVYGDALRDLIAAGMDLDWRNNEVDHATVDTIMDEMFREAGIDAADRETTSITVTVIPYVYAAERDGWATGALFAVDGADTVSETVVHGGGYASTVTETDANEFVIDGGVIANLARQAAANGTTIDAITKDQPWRFDSVKHFQDKNYLATEGLLYLPYELGEQSGLEMDLFGSSADNGVRVGTTAAAIETTGEKWMARADIALTVASVGAMLLPGGLALAGLTRAANATLWAARGTLLGSTIYSAARGAYDLNQMRGLGMDIGWSNRAARSTYLDMLGTAAGIGAMAGGRLTRELLDAAGPGLVTRAAKSAYLGTQAGNLIDLGTGGWLSLDGLRQVLLAGDDAKARDWLMAVMGPAMLSLGAVGIVHESNQYRAHRSGDHLQDDVDEGEVADLAAAAANDTQKPHVQRPVNKLSPDYRPTALRARLPRAAEDAYTPLPEHKEPTILFRGDTRGPDEIFVDGFTADGQPYPNGIISTSLSASDAKGFATGADVHGRPNGGGGWLYTIVDDVSDGDIVSSLPVERGFPRGDHYEIRFGDAIPPERILAARRVSPDRRLVGEPIYNPDFADSARLPSFREELLGGAATKEGRTPPPLNLKIAALWTLAVQLGLGNLGPFNIMSSAFAGWIANVSSAYSKSSWLNHNHSMIDVFGLAARGMKKEAEELLEKVIKHAPWWGAAKLNDEEADALWNLVRQIAIAAEKYWKAREALTPEQRNLLPDTDIRKMAASDGIVFGWLPKRLQDAPEIDTIMTAMREDRDSEYYGLDSQAILRKLSVRLGGLPAGEIPDVGVLAKRLSKTQVAREAYQTLYELVREALPGKADPKGSEPAGTPPLPHYSQSLLKLRGYKDGDGITGVLDLAARGRIEWVNRLGKILAAGPRDGEARLTDAEIDDVRSMVDLVADAGADYREALRGVSSELRKVLPRMIDVRGVNRPTSAEIVQQWLEAPEIANIINWLAKDNTGEYYNKDRKTILEELSAKLDGLARDEIEDGGILAERLLATCDTREAYRTLDQILREARQGRAGGKEIDHKAAEKYPGSSLAPATWPGYSLKMLSFAGPANMFFNWLAKPIEGLTYIADPVRAVPTMVVKGIYLAILSMIDALKKAFPFPRSPKKEEELQKLDAERKRWNTAGDYMSLFSAASYILAGIYYLLKGDNLMAGLLFSQAASSIAWVMVQQNPHLKIAEKLRLHRDLMEKLEIPTKAKPVIRWSSISLGVVVPTVLVIEDILSDKEDSKSRSILDWTFEGMEALDGDGYVPVWPAAGPARPTRPLELSETSGPSILLDPPAPQQLVIARDGLNLGTFVEMRPKDSLAENGRLNPDLDELGYRWVEAKDGDSIRLIASRHSVDVAETVMLNMDHIADPSSIFPGDRIYLPN